VAFLDLVSELSGVLPSLSPQLAEKYVNRAWSEIRGARLWSFLVTDGVVVCPAQVTDGAVSYTQYDTTATFDADASAALLAQTVVGATPGLTNLQLRFNPTSTSPATSQVYSILTADATNPAAIVVTVDRIIVEATSADAGYQCYRAYVTPPIPDFLSWLSVVDMTNGYKLRMDVTSAQIDGRDPQRQSQGQAYWIANMIGNVADPVTGATSPNPNVDAGTQVYELWPHPTSGQTFYTRFRRQGADFVNPTDTQPLIISDALIVQRALGWHAYQWAMANVGHYPQFKGVNWVQAINSARSYYKDELLDSKRADDEMALQTVWNRGHGLRTGYGGFKGMTDYPIDAAFLQSHLVRF
jgi:hypothetical protein